LRALLPLDGGSLDERFAALKPPGPREPGAPVHPDDFKWLTAAAFGVLIGWHFASTPAVKEPDARGRRTPRSTHAASTSGHVRRRNRSLSQWRYREAIRNTPH